MIKPLDIVKYNEHVGLITEVSEFISDGKPVYQASIEWFGKTMNKTAWWEEQSLTVIDNLPNVLSRELRHPFSSGKHYEDDIFPIKSSLK